MLVYKERGKLEHLEKNHAEQGREPTTKSTHMTPSPGVDPGPHYWEASALTTVPTLLPVSIRIIQWHICAIIFFLNSICLQMHSTMILKSRIYGLIINYYLGRPSMVFGGISFSFTVWLTHKVYSHILGQADLFGYGYLALSTRVKRPSWCCKQWCNLAPRLSLLFLRAWVQGCVVRSTSPSLPLYMYAWSLEIFSGDYITS